MDPSFAAISLWLPRPYSIYQCCSVKKGEARGRPFDFCAWSTSKSTRSHRWRFMTNPHSRGTLKWNKHPNTPCQCYMPIIFLPMFADSHYFKALKSNLSQSGVSNQTEFRKSIYGMTDLICCVSQFWTLAEGIYPQICGRSIPLTKGGAKKREKIFRNIQELFFILNFSSCFSLFFFLSALCTHVPLDILDGNKQTQQNEEFV